MTHRARTSTLVITWATALAIAVSICAEAVGHSQSDTSMPPWLGDVPGLGAIAPDRTSDDAPVRLKGCTVANPLLKDDPDRVGPFVPDDYRLGENGFFGPGVATIIVAYMPCDEVVVDGGRPAPAVISLIAVQVVADPIGGEPVDALYDVYNRSTLNLLPSSSWYLLAAQTDHEALAARLRGVGLPVEHDPRLAYHRDYDGTLKKDGVRSHRGRYRVTTTTRFADVFTHNHDWFFWHGAPSGQSSQTGRGGRTGFFLHLNAMDDSSCGYHLSPVVQQAQPACGAQVTAKSRSPIARFLGATSRETPYAFNHPPSSARGYIDLPPK